MATVNGKFWNLNIPAPIGDSDEDAVVLRELSVTPGSTGDIRQICRLPRGVTIAGAMVQIGDMDTGAGLVFSLRLNNGTTTKDIINLSSAGQAGGVAQPTKGPATEPGLGFTTDSKLWWVELIWTTQAAGAQAADLLIILKLTGWYQAGALTE